MNASHMKDSQPKKSNFKAADKSVRPTRFSYCFNSLEKYRLS
jgi:hypothetical protein